MTTAAELNPYLFFGENLWDDDPDNDGVPNGIGAPSLESVGEVAGGIAAAATGPVGMAIYTGLVTMKNIGKDVGDLVEGKVGFGEFALSAGKELGVAAVSIATAGIGGGITQAIDGAAKGIITAGKVIGNMTKSALSSVGGFFVDKLNMLNGKLDWRTEEEDWENLAWSTASSAVAAGVTTGVDNRLVSGVMSDTINSAQSIYEGNGVNISLDSGMFGVPDRASRDLVAFNLGNSQSPNPFYANFDVGKTEDWGFSRMFEDIGLSDMIRNGIADGISDLGKTPEQAREARQRRHEERNRQAAAREAIANGAATRETMFRNPFEDFGSSVLQVGEKPGGSDFWSR